MQKKLQVQETNASKPMETLAQSTEESPVLLTKTELDFINARARFELVQIILAQALIALVVALLAWLIGGFDAGWSALGGSAAYFVPNFLFALRLFVATFQHQGANPVVFLAGELLKICAAIGLLFVFVYLGGERVDWLSMIIGLIAVLKGYMLILMFGTRFTLRTNI